MQILLLGLRQEGPIWTDIEILSYSCPMVLSASILLKSAWGGLCLLKCAPTDGAIWTDIAAFHSSETEELTSQPGLSGGHHCLSCHFFPWKGGPPIPDCAHSHCHTGCHLERNPEWLLCPYLQAGGQHQWGGLDDVPTWEKPQGKGLFVFFACTLVSLAADRRENNREILQAWRV